MAARNERMNCDIFARFQTKKSQACTWLVFCLAIWGATACQNGGQSVMDSNDPRSDTERSSDSVDSNQDDSASADQNDSALYTGDCNGLYATAAACYGAALTEQYRGIVEDYTKTCQSYLDMGNVEMAACVACIMPIYEQCPEGYQQINAGISTCRDSCEVWMLDVRDSLPTRPKVAITCDAPEDEICDNIDNDCDGEVDERQICPDDRVENTVPFEGHLYVTGPTVRGQSDSHRMRAIWPNWESETWGPFDGANSSYSFAPDGTLYYGNGAEGIFRYQADGADVGISAEPCVDELSLQNAFAVSADGSIFFSCKSPTPIYRNNAPLTSFNAWFIGLLADGRIIAATDGEAIDDYRSPSYAEDIIVLDSMGNELSRLSPHVAFGDEYPMWDLINGASVRGNQATVAFLRVRPNLPEEVVVYNLGPNNDWLLVRRVALQVVNFQRHIIAISDGTVFTLGLEEGYDGMVIHGYLPNGEVQVVWHSALPNESIIGQLGMKLAVGP